MIVRLIIIFFIKLIPFERHYHQILIKECLKLYKQQTELKILNYYEL